MHPGVCRSERLTAVQAPECAAVIGDGNRRGWNVVACPIGERNPGVVEVCIEFESWGVARTSPGEIDGNRPASRIRSSSGDEIEVHQATGKREGHEIVVIIRHRGRSGRDSPRPSPTMNNLRGAPAHCAQRHYAKQNHRASVSAGAHHSSFAGARNLLAGLLWRFVQGFTESPVPGCSGSRCTHRQATAAGFPRSNQC